MKEKKLLLREITEVEREILKLISKNGWEITFHVMIRRIPGFAGDKELCASENIILWRGLSSMAVQILTDLLTRDLVYYERCRVEAYLLDGGCPDMPLWTRKAGLIPSVPHWIPVRLYPGRSGFKE